jgi:MYXO-CTERM domain-containing protein
MTPGSVSAQDAAGQPTQSQNTNHDERGFNFGWLGLLGLAGLAGLRRREPTPSARLASDAR